MAAKKTGKGTGRAKSAARSDKVHEVLATIVGSTPAVAQFEGLLASKEAEGSYVIRRPAITRWSTRSAWR